MKTVATIVTVAVLMMAMILVSGVNAELTSNVQMDGTGLITGDSTMITDTPTSQSVYNENLFGTSGSYKGYTTQGTSGSSSNRLITGQDIHYSEAVGYQGVKTTENEQKADTPCADKDVEYTSAYGGSTYMMEDGTIQTGSSTGAKSVGYDVKASGTGTGSVWSNVYTAYGKIAGCGTTVTNSIKQLGSTRFSSHNTVNGKINMSSLFRFSW